MKFKYAYEKLLQYHKQQEGIAHRDYIESLNGLEDARNNLHYLENEEEVATQELYELRRMRMGTPVWKVKEIEEYLIGQDVRVRNYEAVVNRKEKEAEAKQDILIAAAKEVKVFEKLKERRLDEYKKKAKRNEAKMNDEVVVTRFRREEQE